MRVAVLGAGGYLGGALTAGLAATGHAVEPLRVHPAASADAWDAMIHAAGPRRDQVLADVERAVEGQVGFAAALTRWADRTGGRMVYLSSMHVYGFPRGSLELPRPETDPACPGDLYAALKVAGEQVTLANPRGLVLRLAHVYGVAPGAAPHAGSVIMRWLAAARDGRPLEVDGDGSHAWDFVHVADVVRAVGAALDRPAVGSVVNIGGGQPVYLVEAAERLRRATGGDSQVLRASDRRLRGCWLDIRRAGDQLGWVPEISLEAGFAELAREVGDA